MDGLRKVLFSEGMSGDYLIIITDAPKDEIEKWCYRRCEEMENGENTFLDMLKKYYYVKVLADSVVDDFDRGDIEVIGYNEAYDFSDYYTD